MKSEGAFYEYAVFHKRTKKQKTPPGRDKDALKIWIYWNTKNPQNYTIRKRMVVTRVGEWENDG